EWPPRSWRCCAERICRTDRNCYRWRAGHIARQNRWWAGEIYAHPGRADIARGRVGRRTELRGWTRRLWRARLPLAQLMEAPGSTQFRSECWQREDRSVWRAV